MEVTQENSDLQTKDEGELDIKSILQTFFADFPFESDTTKLHSKEKKFTATLDLLLKSVKTYQYFFFNGNNSFHKEEYYFSYWIVYRLVAILSMTHTQPELHQKSARAVFSLSTLLKYKHHKLYIIIMRTLVKVVEELHSFAKNELMARNPSQPFPVFVEHFKVASPGSVPDGSSLKLDAMDNVWMFLGNMSEIMALFASDSCASLGSHVKILWKIFCDQAVWEQKNVQEVSLRCLSGFLRCRFLNMDAHSDDLFNVIISCLKDVRNIHENDLRSAPFLETLADLIKTAIEISVKPIPTHLIDVLAITVSQIRFQLVSRNFTVSVMQMVSNLCIQQKCYDSGLRQCLGNCAHTFIDFCICSGECFDKRVEKCLADLILFDVWQSNQTIDYSLPETTLGRLHARLKGIINDVRRLDDCKELKNLWMKLLLLLGSLLQLVERKDEFVLNTYLAFLAMADRVVKEIAFLIFDTIDKVKSPSKTQQSKDDMMILMRELLETIKRFLRHHKSLPSTIHMLPLFMATVTLPWFPKLVSNPEYVAMLATSAKNHLHLFKDMEIHVGKCLDTGTCLETLTLFPSNFSPICKFLVFNDAMECVKNEELQRKAFELFPALCTNLDVTYQSRMIDPLLQLSSNYETFQNLLPAVLRTLGCAMCQCSRIFLEVKKYPYTSLLVKCTVCDLKTESKNAKAAFTTFYDFLDHFVDSVLPKLFSKTQLSFLGSLERLDKHIILSSNFFFRVLSVVIDLIDHSDVNIRVKFGKLLPCLVTEDDRTTKIIATKLNDVCTKASVSKNIKLQDTIVRTISELGKTAGEDLLLVVVVSLLEMFLNHEKIISSLAFTQIHSVAKCRGKTSQEFFADLKYHLCTFVVETVIKRMKQNVDHSGSVSLKIFRAISDVFEFRSIRALMQCAQSMFIPQLVQKALPECAVVLRCLATELKVNYRKDLLLLNFNFIFSFLVRNCSGEELKDALAFVERETNVDLGSLLKSDTQSVVNQLLLHLHSSYNKVFTGLSILASKADGSVMTDTFNSEQMAEFLQPRLLGILVFFNAVLLDDRNHENQRLALASLIQLMKMMGEKHISVVRVKVMAILKLALQFDFKSWGNLCCDAWQCFVHCLDVTSLRQMLGQILVALQPLVQYSVEKVANIFHYLIVKRRKDLAESFKDICCSIPDLPEFDSVRHVFKNITKKSSELRDKLRLLMKGVSHESSEVRLHALLKLKTLLKENQKTLHEYVTNKDEVDPVVCHLIDTLIARCDEPSSQAIVAECLGELGAIDPGWFPKRKQTSDEPAVFEMMCDSPLFAVDLLNELARAFVAAADTRSQDFSAYAIQEVLQVYECSSNVSTSSGYKIWRDFPEHVQEILKPHFLSKYRLSAQSSRTRTGKLIFGSNIGQNFNDWISNWTLELVSKVRNCKAQQVFNACSAVFKYNTNTAIFLLPHIMLYVAIDGTPDDHKEVYNEMLAILDHLVEEEMSDVKDKENTTDFSHRSAQTIFSLLDFLTRWARLKADNGCQTQTIGTILRFANTESSDAGDERSKVEQFLDGIPQKTLATASFRCKAFARSLMHFEQFMMKSGQDLQANLNFIQRLYWALNEPDGVMGVAAVRNCPASLEEVILQHESEGKIHDAVAHYQSAIQLEPDSLESHKRLMKCWISLDNVYPVLKYASGLLEERPYWGEALNSNMLEACWRLGQWEGLESNMPRKLEPKYTDWSTAIGRILLATRRKDKDDFTTSLQKLRLAQMEPLSAARMESGSYQRGYDFIVRLHILNELEEGLKHVFEENFPTIHQNIEEMLSKLETRLCITRASFQTREPILSLRRVMFRLLIQDDRLTEIEDHFLLQTAKMARKTGHFQTADSYLRHISEHSNTTAFRLEQSKLLCSQGDSLKALLRLQKWIAYEQSSLNENSTENTLTKAKTLLYVARWMEETANYKPQECLAKYKDAVNLHSQWENSNFYLAKYYEKIMNSVDDTKKSGKLDFLPFVMKHYGDSLKYGDKFIYQTVSKILQLWLDFGDSIVEQEEQSKSDKAILKQKLENLNNIISELTENLPPYKFFTAFPQLISRICHRNEEVWTRLKTLISKLMMTYPQQAIWLMMAVSKSSLALRKGRCQQIFTAAKRSEKSLGKFIEDACKLAHFLCDVSEKNRGKENVLSISQDFGSLKRLVMDNNFSPIIIPLQSSLTVTLPTGKGENKRHYPFPESQPTFIGFDDKVHVFQSLARPKKITVKGSDGQNYTLLCKPKDDLRKDSRTMEFNSLINKYLRKDPECRRRQLHIRTYAVVPLNEECGLLEWVQNTAVLRKILLKMYKEKNFHTRSSELKRLYEAMTSSPKEERLKIFETQLLSRHPAIFNEWFLKMFPTPISWYNSRLSYCRTLAVMSMVGYILGLGDRHGENILLDSTTGDCVHVDFNCLFNKGETFDCPEVVPFRLTHNMVQAMGPLGYEGVFRRSCEVTLKVMRDESDSLLSVLKTFVYDPLVEWGERRLRGSGAAAKEQGLKIVKQIDQRLRGYSKNKILLPLSIEGEVHRLITEATDIDNLSRMYIGWAAYL